ncbi:MAG: GGDEF domain-containing protein [Actinomycetota bacterium]|nr:GGDEF domain-containing protein [Actinomycetota bacterium]
MDRARSLPYELLLQAVPTPVAVSDLDGRLLLASEAFARLVEVGEAALEPDRDATERSAGGDGPPAELVGWVRSRTGEDLRAAARLVRPDDGSAACYLVSLPVSGSSHDPLTGLVVRDVLLFRLEQALAARIRHGGEVELVVLDLDRFAQVNAAHGHLVGDRVLLGVARRLLAVTRPEDTVCWWGGDEFLVLLEDPELTSGAAVCDRVGAAVAAPLPVDPGLEVQVGVSCAWVRALRDDDAVSLLHRADVQMHERKRTARGPGDPPLLEDRLRRARTGAAQLSAQRDRLHSESRLTYDAVLDVGGAPGEGAPGETGPSGTDVQD